MEFYIRSQPLSPESIITDSHGKALLHSMVQDHPRWLIWLSGMSSTHEIRSESHRRQPYAIPPHPERPREAPERSGEAPSRSREGQLGPKEAHRGQRCPGEVRRGPERPTEAQRGQRGPGPEKPREAKGGSGPQRFVWRATEALGRPREAPRRSERPKPREALRGTKTTRRGPESARRGRREAVTTPGTFVNAPFRH